MEHSFQEPPFLFLELTNHCNMHCTFCPSDELAKPRLHASDADVRSFLQQAKALGLKSAVQFNVLGEPLLNPKVYEYCALCEELGFNVILITNISLLQDKRVDRILEHKNVVLVLSLQTPTAESYKIRKYEKIAEFEDYIKLVTNAIRRKFLLQSQTRIEIHVAAELEDHSLMRDAGSFRLWQIFRDDAEQLEFLNSYVSQLKALGEELAGTYPEFYEAELQRSRSLFAYAYADGTVDERPERLLVAPNQLTEKEFWGWMCAPNVFLRVKRFGFWAKQRAFLAKHLQPDEVLHVEERTEPFDCEMAYNLSMLADGSFSLCCLDYEGEMQMGHIRTNSVESVLASSKRRETVRNAMVHKVCRECMGSAFVFKRSPVTESEQTVEHLGQGWHAYEPDFGGVGGRWTSGKSNVYLYPRLQARSLEMQFYSPHEGGEVLSLDLYEQDGSGEFCFLSRQSFLGRRGEIIRVELPLDLEPFRLYRATINSPTFVPAEVAGRALMIARTRHWRDNLRRVTRSLVAGSRPGAWPAYQPSQDRRTLGIGVVDLRLRGEVLPETRSTTSLVQIALPA